MKIKSLSLIVLVGVVVVIFATQDFKPIQLAPLSMDLFIQVLSTLFVISLFLERFIEVFIKNFRAMRRNQLEAWVEGLEKDLKDNPSNEYIKMGLKDRKLEVLNYKTATMGYALWGSTFFGVLIAAAGIQSLYPFMDPLTFDALDGPQKGLFRVLDILLTGSLLGGGSKAIHTILTAGLDMLEDMKKVKS